MAKKSVKKRLMCEECKKPISRKHGARILMGTYNRPGKPDHDANFHFPCFVDWYNKKVEEKAYGLVRIMQKEMVKADIENIINGKEIQKVAQNLLSNIVSLKNEIKEKNKKKTNQLKSHGKGKKRDVKSKGKKK